jgi:hypothetical protein
MTLPGTYRQVEFGLVPPKMVSSAWRCWSSPFPVSNPDLDKTTKSTKTTISALKLQTYATTSTVPGGISCYTTAVTTVYEDLVLFRSKVRCRR